MAFSLTERIAERAAYAEKLRGYVRQELDTTRQGRSVGRLRIVEMEIDNLRTGGRTRETERETWPKDTP